MLGAPVKSSDSWSTCVHMKLSVSLSDVIIRSMMLPPLYQENVFSPGEIMLKLVSCREANSFLPLSFVFESPQ